MENALVPASWCSFGGRELPDLGELLGEALGSSLGGLLGAKEQLRKVSGDGWQLGWRRLVALVCNVSQACRSATQLATPAKVEVAVEALDEAKSRLSRRVIPIVACDIAYSFAYVIRG